MEKTTNHIFARSAHKEGVEVVWVSTKDVSEAVEATVRGKGVATEIPFDDVSLPDNVHQNPSMEQAKQADTGITPGVMGIASTGTVVVASTQDLEGIVSLYPPKFIAIIQAEDIVSDLSTALEKIARIFECGMKDVVLLTGTSSTGDMGEVVNGVHGPSEISIIVIEQ